MSDALSIQSVRTTWPRMSRPRISSARSAASSGVFASLMPPALPRPPDQHLRLDDDRAADLGGGGARFLGRQCDATLGDGDAEAREELLALVLIEIHCAGG